MIRAKDHVADLIKSCKFSRNEIILATEGECMFFAVALHNIVNEIDAEFATAIGTCDSWHHIMLRRGRIYYDIQGRVLAKFIHAKYGSHRMKRLSKDDLFSANDLRTGKARTTIGKWQKRINARTE